MTKALIGHAQGCITLHKYLLIPLFTLTSRYLRPQTTHSTTNPLQRTLITRTFASKPRHNMPLVVPGIQSQGGEQIDEWTNKLMGKKIGDNHDEVTFAKKDLPSEHRVLQPDSMSTMDHKPDRLNVHVDEQGTVKNVRYG
ncbi:hypothetical protein PMIN06_000376 [Paraphaeosphaeria minitans]